MTLIQKGDEYGREICTRKISEPQEKVTMIGEECDLLGIASPYTYITKSKTLCYTIKVEQFFKDMLSLNPLGLEELKLAASKKLKNFNHLAKEKKEQDETVANFESIKRAEEKHQKRVANTIKHYPMGDKPIVQNITNIIQTNADLGQIQCMKNVEQFF